MTGPDPIIDDEVTLAIRVHVCATDVRDQVARGLLKLLPNLEAMVRPLLDPDGMDSHLTGIELSLPDFKPTRWQPADDIDREALGRIVEAGLGPYGSAGARHALEQVAEMLGVEVAREEPIDG